MKKKRGEEFSHPILAFHGTEQKNITPICETGFKVPGNQLPKKHSRKLNSFRGL